jgi:hypothetical protein
VRIVISHLTRMQPGYICVAGLDLDTGRHIRPVTHGRRLGAHLLRYNHGPFDFGVIVDLGNVRHVGQAPEVEDHDFEPRRTKVMGEMPPAQFFDIVAQASRPRLRDIFGDVLRLAGRTCAVDIGAGSASLGSLIPDACTITLDASGSIRVRLVDDFGTVSLPVTDLRLYEDDFRTPRRDVIRSLAGRIHDGDEVILSVGLTRPFAPDGSSPRHWLQVNNVILSSDPAWQHALPFRNTVRRP